MLDSRPIKLLDVKWSSMKHPLFSENMEDGFSLFLLKCSESRSCLLFGTSALLLFIFASQNTSFMSFLNEHWFGNILKILCVIGALLSWFSAQAHSYKNGHFKLVASIFLLWPISYIHLFYIQLTKKPNVNIK